MKTGGGADAVADRMVSTFDSRKDRNSAGLKGSVVDLPADLPSTVETVRHSFLESDFFSWTVCSQNSFSRREGPIVLNFRYFSYLWLETC